MNIQFNNVVKQFHKKQVLKGISLDIKEGQFVALLGPSGCGKTTLLNAVAGLLDIDGGSIEVAGNVWSKDGYTLPAEQRNVGMVFQDFALWPHLNVFDNVAFGLKIKRLPSAQIKARVQEVLEMVQMGEYARQLPHQLSGGQKQRVAIARALAPNPTVMLMDEPLSSLDAKLREQMRWDLLHVIRQAGITTLYVTHDQVEALSMADEVVLLNQGEVEQAGRPTEIYQRPATTFAATFVGASNLIQGKVAAFADEQVHIQTGNYTLYVNLSHQNLSQQTGGRVGQTRALSKGDRVTVMARPDALRFQAPEEMANDVGTQGCLVHGRIEKRAFHGLIWQYRVAVEGWEGKFIDVWDVSERPTGVEVSIWFPSDGCRIVAETRTALSVV